MGEDRKYDFSWDLLGDIELGRPNLGNTTRLEVYRLMQFCFRDVLEQRYGTEAADEVFYDGRQAGRRASSPSTCCTRPDDLGDFVAELQRVLRELGIGILRVEKADAEKGEFVVTVSEDLDCSGLPDIGRLGLRLRRGLHRRAARELHGAPLRRQGGRLLVHRRPHLPVHGGGRGRGDDPAPDEPRLAAALEALRRDAAHRPPPSRCPASWRATPNSGGLLDELVALYRFALAISQGRPRAAAGDAGQHGRRPQDLQAALRHLTWQTQRVAAGDFSQRVDFMGEFSEAFNSMVVALTQARAELARAQRSACRRRRPSSRSWPPRRAHRRLQPAQVQRTDPCRDRARAPLRARRCRCSSSTSTTSSASTTRMGHEAGDEVLVVLAGLIRAGIRATDSLARWGGEEFVVLSPEVAVDEAMGLAERLRSAAERYAYSFAGRVTVSIGVAQHRAGETPDELFARADEALYGRRKADATASRSPADGSSGFGVEPARRPLRRARPQNAPGPM